MELWVGIDAYPGGRMPALAPITWTSDGWPKVTTVNGTWGQTYPLPNLTPHPVPSLIGTNGFTTATLAAKWEWNHNPDDTKWSTGNGLRLQTATVTNDLYRARNTLTHRIQGPSSTATVELDPSAMANGDRAGLAILRDSSAWYVLLNRNSDKGPGRQRRLLPDQVAALGQSSGRVQLVDGRRCRYPPVDRPRRHQPAGW